MATDWRTERVSAGEIQIECRTGGGGPPLWLLQGIDDGFDPLPYQEKLASQFCLILPSLPGFGRAPLPAWMDSVEDLDGISPGPRQSRLEQDQKSL